ncbi:MAG: hypothetical protein ACRYF3_13580 [Janthinobacterium lividum]
MATSICITLAVVVVAGATMPDVDEQMTRAHSIGKQLWSPEAEFDHHSFEFVHPLCKLMLSAGMALGETDADLNELLAAVQQGMEEARTEYNQVIQTHAERAQCDPGGKYAMCEYCQAYARSMALSTAGRRRWAEETKDPARRYAVTDATWSRYSGEGKIHERGCSAMTREINFADHAIETLSPYDAKHGGVTVGWPHLLTRQEAEAQNRNRCRVCSPDLPDRVARATAGWAANGQFGASESLNAAVEAPSPAGHR